MTDYAFKRDRNYTITPGTAFVNTTTVTASATSVQLLAANDPARIGAMIFNRTTTTKLYVKYGTTASATDFTVRINAGGYFEFPEPVYVGRVDGIWEAGSAATEMAHITEEVG